MKKVILVLIMFLSSCTTTNGPNLNLEIGQLSTHPVVVIRPQIIEGISYADNIWVDFDFELEVWKKTTKRGTELRPSNIVIINSSHPSSIGLAEEATKAFSKWVFKEKQVPNYRSKRFVIRSLLTGSLNEDKFDCRTYSCIKK